MKIWNFLVLVFCFEFVTRNIMKISANDVFFIQLLIYFRCRNDVRTSVSYPWARPSSQYHRTCRWGPPFLWHSLPTAFWTSWVNLLFDKIFPILYFNNLLGIILCCGIGMAVILFCGCLAWKCKTDGPTRPLAPL